MKNSFKLFGIALAVLMVLAIAACDDSGGQGPDAHVHSFGTTWKTSTTQHWHECSCGERTDVGNHTGNPCTVCGYTADSGGESDSNTFYVANDDEWTNALGIIKSGSSNKSYTIYITENFCTNALNVWFSGGRTFGSVQGITVTIVGDKELSIDTQYGKVCSLLRLFGNQTVIIEDLKLKGVSGSLVPLVHLEGPDSVFTMKGSAAVTGHESAQNCAGVQVGGSGSIFTMQDYSIVSNNTIGGVSSIYGSGVGVLNGASFIMRDHAKVTGNTCDNYHGSGGGVCVGGGGTFTMEDYATVSGNTANESDGGGVANSGTFTMQGYSSVTENSVDGRGFGVHGGGVYNSGSFTMMDHASVSGNELSGTMGNSGGGVSNGGTFSLQDFAEVSNNTVYSDSDFHSYGGGVSNSGTFTIQDFAKVSGNTLNCSDGTGGGVYFEEGFLIMTGGEISGNTATVGGGGLAIYGYPVNYNKTGGTISGYTNGDSSSNVVKNLSGVVQNNKGHAVLARTSDSYKSKEMNSEPSNNLSFIREDYVDPGTYGGTWDYSWHY